ncbi:MAG: alpha/beta hydrolase [Candidatus Dormibacteraeota bacterium]|nr:alpha/beta hydrolase [Candidatus Dormibacteraeota bacterium]
MTETRITTADHTELAVSVTGSGPPLLLIPGLGATRVVFDPLLPFLTQHREVVVYDQRGVGASDITPGPYDTEHLADDAVAVLDGCDISRCAVMGASFGGMVATWLALRHPQRLTSLVLAATSPGYSHLVAEPSREASDMLLGKGARTPEEAYRRACAVLYSERFLREHAAFIDEQVRERSRRPIAARAFQAQFTASRTHDVWDELPSIHPRTLVMHGGEDAVMPIANARAMAGRIPGARFIDFVECGHLFFHEEPERTARELLAFTDRGA